ncbi:hypothetical protein B0H14DRAFT_2828297 [Mycena olivaceomarginata]|nr:hypothetical protein B0H14DRAFT_2828297 [Mycena olivaceomarginata]
MSLMKLARISSNGLQKHLVDLTAYGAYSCESTRRRKSTKGGTPSSDIARRMARRNAISDSSSRRKHLEKPETQLPMIETPDHRSSLISRVADATQKSNSPVGFTRHVNASSTKGVSPHRMFSRALDDTFADTHLRQSKPRIEFQTDTETPTSARGNLIAPSWPQTLNGAGPDPDPTELGLYYTPLNPEEVEVEVEVDPTQQAPYGNRRVPAACIVV